MSRFLTKKEDGTYLEEIETLEVCRWRINDVCCSPTSRFAGDVYCECTSKEERECFVKEDGVIYD